MKQFTEQQVFNRVARHLLKQRRKSIDATGGCLYRGKDGLQCAIGCLIPNRVYSEALEGVCAGDLPGDVLHDAGLSKIEPSVLGMLQSIHDETHPNSWQRELADVALRLGLRFRP